MFSPNIFHQKATTSTAKGEEVLPLMTFTAPPPPPPNDALKVFR